MSGQTFTPAHWLRTATALGLIALALSACHKPAPVSPAPTVMAVPNGSGAAPVNSAGTSVPPADSVLTPAAAAKADPAAGRTNSSMTRAQESSAMPLPGQNNDHSAPLTPAIRASAP